MNSHPPRNAPTRLARPRPERPRSERPRPERPWPSAPHITAPVFTNAIYDIAAAILAFMQTIQADKSRGWDERKRIKDRLSRVMRALLTLTARMNPFKIGLAFFAAQRAKPAPPSTNAVNDAPIKPDPAPAPEPEPEPRPKTPRAPILPFNQRAPLSARETARRLAALFRELQEIANEARLTIPEELKTYIEIAREIAAAPTLPARPFYYNRETKRTTHTPAPWQTLEL